jgi:hypothetical protein
MSSNAEYDERILPLVVFRASRDAHGDIERARHLNESREWYDPMWHHAHHAETREALDLAFNDHFSASQSGGSPRFARRCSLSGRPRARRPKGQPPSRRTHDD